MALSQSPDMMNAFHIYKRLFGYIRRYWWALLFGAVASMCYSSINAWFIYFLEPLLNKGLVAKNHHFLRMAPLLVLGVFLIRGIASFIANYYIALASKQVIVALRQDLFKHLQRLPTRFYDKNTTGQLLSVLLYGVDQVANASADVLTTAIQALFLIIGLVKVMFGISWKLTLMYFTIVPLVVIVMRITNKRVRRLSLSIQDSMGVISHCAEENIQGAKVIKAFDGYEFETNKFNAATRINRQREMKVVVARSLSTSSVQLISAMALSFTLYVATLDIADALLTPGGFVAMIAAMLALLNPMKELASVQTKLFRGLAGAQNVFELLDEKPEMDDGKIPLFSAKGAIQYRQVSFSYEEQKRELHDINLTIAPGEIVALVGRSGSGKSTLVNLLMRLYDQYSGEILLDGLSIRDYSLKDLRRQIALVSQQVTLFQDTIANNIAYGLTAVSESQLIEAAKAAHAFEFIERLPQGFQSMIGENGVLLSGGQRQRLAIARAVLKNSPILILDEATSALDTESERYIQTALQALMASRTTLVVAHRLSTIEKADKIVVMEEGRIVEVGNHQSLLAENSHYAKLYHLQFKDDSLVMSPTG